MLIIRLFGYRILSFSHRHHVASCTRINTTFLSHTFFVEIYSSVINFFIKSPCFSVHCYSYQCSILIIPVILLSICCKDNFYKIYALTHKFRCTFSFKYIILLSCTCTYLQAYTLYVQVWTIHCTYTSTFVHCRRSMNYILIDYCRWMN